MFWFDVMVVVIFGLCLCGEFVDEVWVVGFICDVGFIEYVYKWLCELLGGMC